MQIEKQQKVAKLYTEIMEVLGIKETEDNKETPKRVAKSLVEMTENNGDNYSDLLDVCTTFRNTNRHKDVQVIQDDIEFTSICSHHHLPFYGKIKITYTPNNSIIGLSKFQRIADYLSKKPQVQEDLTVEIGEFLVHILEPLDIEVELYDCVHTCMVARGVKSRAKTTTKYKWIKI